MLRKILNFQKFNKFIKTTNQCLKQQQQITCRHITTTHASNFAQSIANDEELENEESTNRNPFAKETPKIDIEETPEKRATRLKVLKLEADIARQDGRRVPKLESLKDVHWDHILTLPTKSSRTKYYQYLWQVEVKKLSKERKKVERAEHMLKVKEDLQRQNEENTHIIYGLSHTTLFLRIYDSTINQWQNKRLINAMQFAPKLVIDCSYDQYMTKREAYNAAKQLMLSFADNRAHDDPLDLHYCNVDMNSICIEALQRFIPTMYNPEFPINVHKESFMDLFPKENIVYLTPHCRNDLVEYNPDDVYVIGAMVDTVNNEPLSLAKAKRLGIRMARLPLDQYLQWGSGSGKSLTINQMVNIMADLNLTGDWNKAFKHVPRRKIIDMDYEKVLEKKAFTKRANQLNVRIDRLFEHLEESNKKNRNQEINVRSHKENLKFNLETWGTKKNKKNTNT